MTSSPGTAARIEEIFVKASTCRDKWDLHNPDRPPDDLVDDFANVVADIIALRRARQSPSTASRIDLDAARDAIDAVTLYLMREDRDEEDDMEALETIVPDLQSHALRLLAIVSRVTDPEVQEAIAWLVREDKGRGALRIHPHHAAALRSLLTEPPENAPEGP